MSRITRAQSYPSRLVTIIVPFSAGGTTDVIARILGEHMSRTLRRERRRGGRHHRLDACDARKPRWIHH